MTRPERIRPALEAARLSKIDLTTAMVREFTDLQGIVGGIYARLEGARKRSGRRSTTSTVPCPPTTNRLARRPARSCPRPIASTRSGFFGLGLVPTGSKDRAGCAARRGFVLIVFSRGWRADWSSIFRKAVALHAGALAVRRTRSSRISGPSSPTASISSSRSGASRPTSFVRFSPPFVGFRRSRDRARAIAAARRRDDFRSLSLSVKRIRNILPAGVDAAPDPAFYREPAEHALAADLQQLSRTGASLMSSHRYPDVIAAMLSLGPALGRFFEDVLVNAPEPELKANRQALLGAIRRFRTFADISRSSSKNEVRGMKASARRGSRYVYFFGRGWPGKRIKEILGGRATGSSR